MSVQTRTRIKMCGFTREADVQAAVQAGADAIGFVLYPPSPRAVSIERAAELSSPTAHREAETAKAHRG